MNQYTDLKVIECNRLHSEEAKSGNNENFALWTNNLQDIVHLDAGLNNRHEIALRGEWPKEKVEQHYYYLEKFLKKLSKDFNKKVIVTIHPGYNIEDHQTFLSFLHLQLMV